ncbi:MAG: hypothetical protein U0414_07080 [Polyangiaceae bacterium]
MKRIVSIVALSMGLAACEDPPASTSGAPASTGKPSATTSASHKAPVTSAPSGSGSAKTAPAPAPGGEGFTATIEGKTYTFKTVTISTQNQVDVLELSTAEGGCKAETKDSDLRITFDLPLGPGGKHFAPGPIVGPLREGSKLTKGMNGAAVVTLEKGDVKKGDKVKGTLQFDWKKGDLAYTGKGGFEAQVCEELMGDFRYQATPEKADEKPAAGEIEGTKWASKSAVVVLGTLDGVDVVQSVDLFDGKVDCKSYGEAAGKKHVSFTTNLPLPSDVFKYVGAPQPAAALSYGDAKKKTDVFGPIWVKFDALDAKDGGTAKGSLFGETAENKKKDGKPSKISGTFEAAVCKAEAPKEKKP